MKLSTLGCLAALLALTGCWTGCATSHSVIVSTGTVFGMTVSENPATALYEVRLGYARTEFAYVPSNRSNHTNQPPVGNGAKDTANVIMEIRMENLLKGGLIYQRLAVGDVAVAQPGASLLFAKAPDGTLDSAVARAVAGVPAPNADIIAAMLPLAQAYQAASEAKKQAFNTIASKYSYADFSAFLTDAKVTPDIVKAVTQDLKNATLVP
jgi:hypothetical protein